MSAYIVKCRHYDKERLLTHIDTKKGLTAGHLCQPNGQTLVRYGGADET